MRLERGQKEGETDRESRERQRRTDRKENEKKKRMEEEEERGGEKQGASDKEIQKERNAGNGVGFKKNQGRREITKERQQRTRNGINQVRIRLN